MPMPPDEDREEELTTQKRAEDQDSRKRKADSFNHRPLDQNSRLQGKNTGEGKLPGDTQCSIFPTEAKNEEPSAPRSLTTGAAGAKASAKDSRHKKLKNSDTPSGETSTQNSYTGADIKPSNGGVKAIATGKLRCFHCNSKPSNGQHLVPCMEGPQWLGFKPGEPICQSCHTHLERNWKAYSDEQRIKYGVPNATRSRTDGDRGGRGPAVPPSST